jgi:mRNA-degrading endonuclease toxin of MazEF toxin-antitoxin module
MEDVLVHRLSGKGWRLWQHTRMTSQVITVDRDFLAERSGRLPKAALQDLDAGLRLALALAL